MTAPLPGPQMPMPGPDAHPITVQLKPCCGLLAGDVCDCADLFAEVVAAFASPIRWHVTTAGVEAGR